MTPLLEAIHADACMHANRAMPEPPDWLPPSQAESEWERAEQVAADEYTRRLGELCDQHKVAPAQVVAENQRRSDERFAELAHHEHTTPPF